MYQQLRMFTVVFLLVLFVAPIITGCSTHVAFTYPLDHSIQEYSSRPPDVKIAVLPARDSRGTKNKQATYFLYMVPLMPFGWVNYNRPEASTNFNSIAAFEMNVREDIAKSIALHWQEAGVARSVFFDYGGLADTADYVLNVDVLECRYQGKIYSYLMGVYGPLLWYFGFPAGSSKVSLVIELKLHNRAGELIWTHTIEETWQVLQGIFYNFGRDMEGVAINLQFGLEECLKSNPPPIN